MGGGYFPSSLLVNFWGMFGTIGSQPQKERKGTSLKTFNEWTNKYNPMNSDNGITYFEHYKKIEGRMDGRMNSLLRLRRL